MQYQLYLPVYTAVDSDGTGGVMGSSNVIYVGNGDMRDMKYHWANISDSMCCAVEKQSKES